MLNKYIEHVTLLLTVKKSLALLLAFPVVNADNYQVPKTGSQKERSTYLCIKADTSVTPS